MAIQEIIRMGHPTLRKPAAPWPGEQIGSTGFHSLITDLRDTLRASGGIGLAAPQINISVAVAVIEIVNTTTRYGELEPLPFTVFVNPSITVLEETSAGYWEGCLSIPGLMGYVERPQHIRVDYLDEAGSARSKELDGFLATVFQHEFDHLQGKLYIDRIRDTSLIAFEEEYRAFHLGDEFSTPASAPARKSR